MIQIQNEVQGSEYFLSYIRVWTFRANSKETFNEFIDAFKKAQRPRWVEESANKCWVIH